jgi:hypothetical protein
MKVEEELESVACYKGVEKSAQRIFLLDFIGKVCYNS